MENKITIYGRTYPVTIRDERTGEKQEDSICLDKRQLQAAQMVGQSCIDLIYRLYNRKGFMVLDIGKPTKREITLDLSEA